MVRQLSSEVLPESRTEAGTVSRPQRAQVLGQFARLGDSLALAYPGKVLAVEIVRPSPKSSEYQPARAPGGGFGAVTAASESSVAVPPAQLAGVAGQLIGRRLDHERGAEEVEDL